MGVNVPAIPVYTREFLAPTAVPDKTRGAPGHKASHAGFGQRAVGLHLRLLEEAWAELLA